MLLLVLLREALRSCLGIKILNVEDKSRETTDDLDQPKADS